MAADHLAVAMTPADHLPANRRGDVLLGPTVAGFVFLRYHPLAIALGHLRNLRLHGHERAVSLLLGALARRMLVHHDLVWIISADRFIGGSRGACQSFGGNPHRRMPI
ncbi:MAG: hypothetical protein V2A73_13500 [Pseudomonadota bacterium]